MAQQEAIAPQIFLVVEAGDSARERLACALAAVAAASVLIVPPAGGQLEADRDARLLAEARAGGAAALVLADVGLARRLKTDGVHLPPGRSILDDYRAAREILGPRGIVGAHAGKSRHDAMLLGEAGADYIAFGIPEGVQDVAGGRERRLDLVTWWAEIFEVPCVALDVGTPEDARLLAWAGADFIGVTLKAGMSLAEVDAHVRAMSDAIAAPAG